MKFEFSRPKRRSANFTLTKHISRILHHEQQYIKHVSLYTCFCIFINLYRAERRDVLFIATVDRVYCTSMCLLHVHVTGSRAFFLTYQHQ